MTKKIIVSAIILAAWGLTGCEGSHTFRKAENAQDAGREFIRASLDGDYEKASFYLYADSTNQLLLGEWKKRYDRMSPEEKQQYKDAEIRPINIQALNDSITYYTYANSYKKDTTTVRIIRLDGAWRVDLKEILNAKK